MEQKERLDGITRRTFLKRLGVGGVAAIGIATALNPSGCALAGRPYEYTYDVLSDHPVFGRAIMDGRDYYISTYFGPHNSIDWAGFNGEPIIAPANGTIIRKSEDTIIGGIKLVVRHSNNYRSMYAHLSDYNPKLDVGYKVKRGDIIAFVGNTGTKFGPHLDFKFGIHPPGHPRHELFDPMLYGLLQPFIPLYDLKAEQLDIHPNLRPMALEKLKDTLDSKLGDYDGPEREELRRIKHDTQKMKNLLRRYTVETAKHVPGSPVYTIMLETLAYSAPSSKPVLLTHPLMDQKNPIYTKKYKEGSQLFANLLMQPTESAQ